MPAAAGGRDQVEVLEGTKRGEIEDCAEVDVEAVETLAGEDGDAVGQRPDRGVGETGVVGGRPDADVARRGGKVVAELSGRPVLPPLGDRVGLAPVEVRAVERRDRSGVVEERVRVRDSGLEAELVDDVRPTVAVVVDVDAVEHVVAELEEVRATCGILERDVVGDECDGVGTIGAHEGVGVRRVGDGVLRDLGGFTMG